MDNEKGSHCKIIAHLATLGLTFLRKFFEADNAQRTTLIHQNYHCRFSNLDDALKYRPMPKSKLFVEESEGYQKPQKLDFEGDGYQKRNLAWLWSNQYGP
jgi:hypothetical protein